jgi:hypothetical protein
LTINNYREIRIHFLKLPYTRSITVAAPIPDATQRVARPSSLSVLSSSSSNVPKIIVPVAPKGCPMAFASVALLFLQAFDVDSANVNPNGGAIAMGHPLGATGTMILGTLLDELERTDKELGLATLCVASGMGAATVIERV